MTAALQEAIKDPRTRTLGLPPSQQRDTMQEAYNKYRLAQALHNKAHNSWRRAQRAHGDDASQTKGALTKATKAAVLLGETKRQYREAKTSAQAAA